MQVPPVSPYPIVNKDGENQVPFSLNPALTGDMTPATEMQKLLLVKDQQIFMLNQQINSLREEALSLFKQKDEDRKAQLQFYKEIQNLNDQLKREKDLNQFISVTLLNNLLRDN